MPIRRSIVPPGVTSMTRSLNWWLISVGDDLLRPGHLDGSAVPGGVAVPAMRVNGPTLWASLVPMIDWGLKSLGPLRKALR
jgi:hypothetical protein